MLNERLCLEVNSCTFKQFLSNPCSLGIGILVGDVSRLIKGDHVQGVGKEGVFAIPGGPTATMVEPHVRYLVESFGSIFFIKVLITAPDILCRGEKWQCHQQ